MQFDYLKLLQNYFFAGIERARHALDEADVTLLVIDAANKQPTEEWSEYIKREIDEIVPKEMTSKVLAVMNKTDLLPEGRRPTTVERQSKTVPLLWVSEDILPCFRHKRVLQISCRTLNNVDSVGREVERVLADGIDLITDVDFCLFAHVNCAVKIFLSPIPLFIGKTTTSA